MVTWCTITFWFVLILCVSEASKECMKYIWESARHIEVLHSFGYMHSLPCNILQFKFLQAFLRVGQNGLVQLLL